MAGRLVEARLSDEERFDWLRLIRSENVGPRTFYALVARCGGAKGALAALPELARRGGAGRPIRIAAREEVVRELELARRLGVRFVALRRARISAGAAPNRLGAAAAGPERPRGGAAAAGGGHCRLAQCVGGRPRLRRPPGARAGRRRAMSSSRAWRAASISAHMSRRSRPAPSASSPEATPGPTRRRRRRCCPASPNMARSSRKCRSNGRRAGATSRAATASFPACRSARLSSRRRAARAR